MVILLSIRFYNLNHVFSAIGGVTGDLLEQTAQMFNQISANFSSFQIHDNINLLCKARDNILTILNEYVISSMLSVTCRPN
ncbi:hypothetical protein Gogos_005560 [Gossypium gossypioides]|uniref:Uncharacterized protein n=1 Tax=Gossypium gossypioides TaxID=34282 RepID=A0A7J9CWD0_GOSGO|nr:hypothetical protein [Gossypium gossypioides]